MFFMLLLRSVCRARFLTCPFQPRRPARWVACWVARCPGAPVRAGRRNITSFLLSVFLSTPPNRPSVSLLLLAIDRPTPSSGRAMTMESLRPSRTTSIVTPSG
jgi:hypothetical protein